MNDIVREFLVESQDNLDRLDRDFIDLEKDAGRKDIISSIFRTIHTIKGTCGFLGFHKLEALAHIAENLLAKMRDGAIANTPEITSTLLATVDAIRTMLLQIENSENDGEEEYAPLKEKLTHLLKADWIPAPSAQNDSLEIPSANLPAEKFASVEAKPLAPEPLPTTAAFGEMLVDQGKLKDEDLDHALRKQVEGDPRRIGEILVAQGSIKADEVPSVLKQQTEQREQVKAQGGAVADSSVRVDVGLLDKLMNLVGELVLERNRILQAGNKSEDTQLLGAVQRLNRITSELQEGVMKTRMQQVGNIWNKFPRVVRDLSLACGKLIRLEVEGKETELDRTLLEAIKDPLTHLIRNAVDHGIETPERRRAAGKAEEGLLTLRAYHEGGQVIMEISDDGGGIDANRIKQKALEKTLITASQSETMDDLQALSLIFLPGFSTAEKVTNVSGRGVGMDVVKTNIERIGGQVEINSVVGKGTTFKVKIPLTLAIVPALVVLAGGERFAIPQVALQELIRVEDHEGLEAVQGSYSYRLRGKLLPLIFLSSELHFSEAEVLAKQPNLKIVVLQADGKPLGLVVEDIRDTEEIVVKPLGKQLNSLDLFSGATIMGDGRVALILDIQGLARRAHLDISGERIDRERDSNATAKESLTTLLLLKSGGENRMVIPLSQVARLEEFKRDKVEKAGNLHVVQYRDEIMPLIPVSEWMPERRGSRTPGDEVEIPGDSMVINVVVYSQNGRNIGLVVDTILDIVDHPFQIQKAAARDGVLGAIVVNEHVTEVLDIERIIQLGDPSFFHTVTVTLLPNPA